MKAAITFYDPCAMEVAQGASVMLTFGGSAMGRDGKDGADGQDGKNGADGQNGRDGTDGKSAYRAAVEGGFGGSEQEFNLLLAQFGIAGNDGRDGANGQDGRDGADGKSAYRAAVEGGYTGAEAQFNASLAGIGRIEQIATQMGDIDAVLDAINGEVI